MVVRNVVDAPPLTTNARSHEMKTKIMYMELKTHEGGHDDRGEARIGRVTFSKSGKSLHYKGKTFHRTRGPVGCGNHFDAETEDIYWISGAKKDGSDRYY